MKPAAPAYRSRRFAKRDPKAQPVRGTAPVAKAIPTVPPPAPPAVDPDLLREALEAVFRKVAEAYAQAGQDAAQTWAQAGADAAVQALADRGMLGKPVVLRRTVKTVVRDGPTPPGGIVGSIEDHEYGRLEDPKP